MTALRRGPAPTPTIGGQTFFELRVETHRLDGRWGRTEPRSATLPATGNQLANVVADLGFVSELLDEVVVDGCARLRVSVGALDYGSSYLRWTARGTMTWMIKLVALGGHENNHFEQVRRAVRTGDKPSVQVLATLVDHARMSI